MVSHEGIREEEIREKLRALGATNVEGTEGIIPVSPPTVTKPEIIEYREFDTTPIARRFRLAASRFTRKIRIAREMKLVRTQGILRKLCVMYRDPRIAFDIIPVKVRNIKFHAFSLKIDGEVVCSLRNNSEEGEEGRTVVWRWRSCPTDPNAYDWIKVAGSADITPSWMHDFIEDQTGALLGRLDKSLGTVQKNKKVEVTGYWSAGLGQLVWTILQIFRTGTVTTRNGFDVTIKYTWLDETQTINRHIDEKVVLPVEGNISWVWD